MPLPSGALRLLDPGLRAAAFEGAAIALRDAAEAALIRADFGRWPDRLPAPGTGFEANLSPSGAVLPFAVGQDLPEGPYEVWTDWAGFCWPLNLGLHPALSLPMGRAGGQDAGVSMGLPMGLPMDLRVIARRGADGFALDLGEALHGLRV